MRANALKDFQVAIMMSVGEMEWELKYGQRKKY